MRKESRFRPSDLGEQGVRHEVNVFVFRRSPEGPEYLLLRPSTQPDSLWRPVVQAIGHHEDLSGAARRAVQLEVGLREAFDLLLPAAGVEEEVGDLHLVGWPVGYYLRRMPPRGPQRAAAQLDWMGFDQAIQQLGLSVHRQNLLQLHWQLAA
ncbi:MAG: hypothetical protein CMJ94_04230 [Planctomycetes bacterium]|nr:hypothetical protein [Planctomycetota bacterium]